MNASAVPLGPSFSTICSTSSKILADSPHVNRHHDFLVCQMFWECQIVHHLFGDIFLLFQLLLYGLQRLLADIEDVLAFGKFVRTTSHGSNWTLSSKGGSKNKD